MSNYIIDVRISGGTDVSPSGGSTRGMGLGGIAGASAQLGLIAGGTMAIVGLLKDMLWVFKPILNLIKGITRTLGLFLQPIAELLFLLVKPLLDFVRPLALLFRAMMMPVMSLLRQYSGVLTAQVASGDNAGAMTTGLDMITLALSGVFVSLAGVIGDVFLGAMQGMLVGVSDFMIGLVSNMLLPVFALIDKVFKTSLVDNLLISTNALKTTVSDSIKGTFDKVRDNLRDGTTIMMDGLVSKYSTKLEDLKGTIIIGSEDGIITPFTDVVETVSENISLETMNLTTNTKATLSDMRYNVEHVMSGNNSIPSVFKSGLNQLSFDLNVFVSDAEEMGRRIKSALSSAQSSVFEINALGKNIIRIG